MWQALSYHASLAYPLFGSSEVEQSDDEIVQFTCLSRVATEEMLASVGPGEKLPSEKLNIGCETALKFNDNSILLLRNHDKSSWLFENEFEYMKIIRRDSYHLVSIVLNGLIGYIGFSLLSAIAGSLLKQSICKLTEFPKADKYEAYSLPNGRLAYLRHRIGTVYDGLWYPSKEIFEQWYHSLFADLKKKQVILTVIRDIYSGCLSISPVHGQQMNALNFSEQYA